MSKKLLFEILLRKAENQMVEFERPKSASHFLVIFTHLDNNCARKGTFGPFKPFDFVSFYEISAFISLLFGLIHWPSVLSPSLDCMDRNSVEYRMYFNKSF